MRTVGLHLRITKDLADLAQRAQKINLTSFQCFLIHQQTKHRLRLSSADYKNFAQIRNAFEALYVHGSYWINLCGKRYENAHHLLHREVEMAKRLGFSHYVLHPGSATGWNDRLQGIDCLARALNTITAHHPEITIVLENTTHAGKSIGSDLKDFSLILEKLNIPEKIKFCIDTAHAHGFGYDIVSPEGQDEFIKTIETTIGIEAVALIHLNDSKELCGLYRDKHALLGEGEIGLKALKLFTQNTRLSNIPIILELPDIAEEKQKNIVQMVHQWNK